MGADTKTLGRNTGQVTWSAIGRPMQPAATRARWNATAETALVRLFEMGLVGWSGERPPVAGSWIDGERFLRRGQP